MAASLVRDVRLVRNRPALIGAAAQRFSAESVGRLRDKKGRKQPEPRTDPRERRPAVFDVDGVIWV